MKTALILFGVASVVVAIGVIALTSWRPRITVGKPTPEEARVKIDKAEAKANTETQAEVEKVNDASNDEILRRAREYINRGMHGK
jgi:hypothetical protein